MKRIRPIALAWLLCVLILLVVLYPQESCMPLDQGRAEIKMFHNLAGEIRYVKRSSGGYKLYLTKEALDRDDPSWGFSNRNTFKNSCGPEAGLNLCRWYGIEKLAGETCRKDDDPEREMPDTSVLPTICAPVISAVALGGRMRTNSWKVKLGSINITDAPGTSTPNFVDAMRELYEEYMKNDYAFYYNHSGNANDWYLLFRQALLTGNPIAVDYRTGPSSPSDLKPKGHFAVIIGIESRTPIWEDDVLFLANGEDEHGKFCSTMTWREFSKLWVRNYYVVGVEVMKLADEYPHTSVFMLPMAVATAGGRGGSGRGTGPGGHPGQTYERR